MKKKRSFIILLFLFVLVLTASTTKYYDNKYNIDSNIIENLKLEKQNYVTIDRMPKDLKRAVILMEDKRFYKHGGYDVKAITRALIADIKARKIVQGGSTITQQLAKNLFLSEDQSLKRKIDELFLSIKLEKVYSKEEILEMYLNIIYYGDGAYGVQEASNKFFNKNIWELSIEECAMLAGIPQAPSLYNPKDNLEKAKSRQRFVLKLLDKNKDMVI